MYLYFWQIEYDDDNDDDSEGHLEDPFYTVSQKTSAQFFDDNFCKHGPIPIILWIFFHKKLSSGSGIGSPLIDNNGDTVVNHESKANLLNQYFASVCIQDNGKQPKFERQVPTDVNIDTVEFNAQIVYNILRQLKPKTRVARYPVFYGSSRISAPISRLPERSYPGD